jgi:hypothetical protein
MRTISTAMLLATLLGFAACAPSEMQVKTARGARYQVERDEVWRGVVAALRQNYPRINILQADGQRMITNWILVSRDVESMQGHMINPNAIFMRVTIAVSPVAPYAIGLDVQAAQYRPGLTDLIPFPHGAEDEPQWVQGRADKLYSSIYGALRTFAVIPGPPQATPLPAAHQDGPDTVQATR